MRGLLQDGAIPLNSGTYSSRSLIANDQKCVNLFPEINPEESDAGAAVSHYPRSGTVPLGNGPAVPGRGRGIWTASNGNLYGAVGANFYYIDANWKYNLLGTLTPGINSPVSLADNMTTAVVVDGSPNGYTFTLGTNAWLGAIVDATGTFIGSTRVDYVDTFLTFNAPGGTSQEWYCSNGDQVTFNALQTGAKSSWPDPVLTHAVNLRQVWLLGSLTSEIWYLSGAIPFPFEEWPNVFVPYGIAAPYSIARADVNLFWLARNKDGEYIAVMTDGYAVKAITTRALEYEFSNYPTVADCVTYTYQQGGHTIIVFCFPTADKSWGYDITTKQWHQRVSIDNNGVFHRDNVAFSTFVSSSAGYPATNVGMDWRTGQIYAMNEQNTFTDNGMPIPFIRSFPHVTNSLKELTGAAFVLDMDTGELPATGEINQSLSPWSLGWNGGFGPLVVQGTPQVGVRISKDGGSHWGNYRLKGFTSSGRNRSMMRWRGWGMGRDLVFEVAWSAPMPTALQGAYFEPVAHAA